MSQPCSSRASTRSSYDRLSRVYDWLAGHGERLVIEEGLRRLGARSDERVLEVGCGTGHSLAALARSVGESGCTCGLDLSSGMLRVARGAVVREKPKTPASLAQADAVALPFLSESFDAVFTSFTLDLFDEAEVPLVLGECRRVLKRGGRICVVSMSRRGMPGLMGRLYGWAHAMFPSYVDCRPMLVQEAMEAAGFQTLASIDASVWGLPVKIVLSERVD